MFVLDPACYCALRKLLWPAPSLEAPSEIQSGLRSMKMACAGQRDGLLCLCPTPVERTETSAHAMGTRSSSPHHLAIWEWYVDRGILHAGHIL